MYAVKKGNRCRGLKAASAAALLQPASCLAEEAPLLSSHIFQLAAASPVLRDRTLSKIPRIRALDYPAPRCSLDPAQSSD